jgi:DNA-binding CsgD family transcriptional regulator
MDGLASEIITYTLQTKPNLADKLRDHFSRYQAIWTRRFTEIKQIILPHVSTAYELYYSPDFTSGKSDILNYSLEFYDDDTSESEEVYVKTQLLLEQTLESTPANLNFSGNIRSFYQLHQSMLAQRHMEQQLLKPLVLQMEENIITTFQKSRKPFRRNTYLSVPANSVPVEILSPREKEVLRLVAQGLMNKEIADNLNIGITTVITHRKNIVEKLGIKTIPGLTVYAYTQGYLDDLILTNED